MSKKASAAAVKVEHSKYFERVKKWYDKGQWTAAMVANAVEKGWITEAEYHEIVTEETGDE